MKNKIFKYLETAKHGYLIITTPDGQKIEIGDQNSTLKTDLKVHDWSFIDLVLSKGDIGFGQAYIRGMFSTEKIENLLLFITLNQSNLEAIYHSNIFYSLVRYFGTS